MNNRHYRKFQITVIQYTGNFEYRKYRWPKIIIYSYFLGFLNIGEQFKLCESIDEDPVDLCEPVNCHMKYKGLRSLFDPIKRQCIPIPVCDSNRKKSSDIVITKYNLFQLQYSYFKKPDI